MFAWKNGARNCGLILSVLMASVLSVGSAAADPQREAVYAAALKGNFQDARSKAQAAASKAIRPQLWQLRIDVLIDAETGKLPDGLTRAFIRLDQALQSIKSRKDIDRVLKDFAALIKRKSDYAPFWSAQASALRLAGNHTASFKSINRAIELAPTEGWYYNNRALAGETSSRSRALADYSKAIELAPQWAWAALTNRGTFNVKIGRRDDALKDFNQAIAKRKNNPDAYYNRGNLNARKKQFKSAISDYTLAIKYDPRFVQAYTNRGVTHRRLGNHKASIADHSKALEINPGHVTALMGRAFAYSATGKPDAALTDIRKATAIQPRNFRLHMTHAMIANRAKLLDEEIKALGKVLQTLPPNQSRRKAQTRKRIQQLQNRQVR